MYQLLIKIFVRDYKNTEDAHVREQYGTVCSIISIVCNIILVVFKLIFGTLVHSVSIVADGYNNLSDAGSNIATFFGFKLANKHPDAEHPYGHGRFEYITGLGISFLIILVGLMSLKDAVLKLFNPEAVKFSVPALIALIFSVFVKIWMGYFNRKAGKEINSTALEAAAQDSMNDVMATSATIVALVASLVTDLPVDSLIGAAVSVVVVISGISIAKSTIDPLLGIKPEPETIKEIEDYLMSYDCVMGVHDLMMHDYGPGRRYLTVHCEVDASIDMMTTHDEIDNIERAMMEKFHILTTIHMDPIDIHDILTNELRDKVTRIVESIDSSLSIHDFRIVRGPTHTNLVFDVLMKDDKYSKKELNKLITSKVKEMNTTYYCVINFEYSFV